MIGTWVPSKGRSGGGESEHSSETGGGWYGLATKGIVNGMGREGSKINREQWQYND